MYSFITTGTGAGYAVACNYRDRYEVIDITLDQALNISREAGRFGVDLSDYVSSERFDPIRFGIDFTKLRPKTKNRNLPVWW